jgi:hypothetical protein
VKEAFFFVLFFLTSPHFQFNSFVASQDILILQRLLKFPPQVQSFELSSASGLLDEKKPSALMY